LRVFRFPILVVAFMLPLIMILLFDAILARFIKPRNPA
jgi:hypothetical protein